MTCQRLWKMGSGRGQRFFCCLILCFTIGTPAIHGETKVVVSEIDGIKTTGTLKSWENGSINIEGDTPKAISPSQVRSIQFEEVRRRSLEGRPMLIFSNGDRIVARAASVKSDELTASWPILVTDLLLPISLEKLTAIILELPAPVADRMRLFREIELVGPGNDIVILSNGDRSAGEFQQLGSAFVELKTPNGVIKLDRNRVRVIRMNPELTATPRKPDRRMILNLVDGSRLTVTDAEIKSSNLIVSSTVLGPCTLPLDGIASCSFYGERVAPITDYEPSKIEFTPYLSATWGLTKDANVFHGPLQIRGVEYTSGLGMHSQMAVTFNLRGNEEEFQSLVGIDDLAHGGGSVRCAIDVDDKRVWTSDEITGESPVASITGIDVRLAKKMTLRVDFGQYADVADYTDWCDPVFILKQK